MGTAIYVYETEDEYHTHYNRMDKEVMFSAPILDMFLKPDEKIWVVSKISKHKERPQLGRSIVHFVNGTVYDYTEGDEVQIRQKDVKYNPKNNQVEFFSKPLRKAALSIRVDRFYGEKPKKKHEINNSLRFYDISRDRLNFILKHEKPI